MTAIKLTEASYPEQLALAASAIRQADSLIIAAGAGMGVDSGLPDFRGTEGFWRAYPHLGRAGIDFREIASPLAFWREPRQAWGFYGHRLALYRRTRPHAGFRLLQQWASRLEHGYRVFTSNVDGQFQAAGYASERIEECHGSIHHLQCLQPCTAAIWRADEVQPEIDPDTGLLSSPVPLCPHCGGTARPNILMFGDSGWIEERSALQERAMHQALGRMRRPVVVEIGAGQDIPTVRYFVQQVLAQRQGVLVRINPRDSAVQRAGDISLPLPALEALLAMDGLM